tara:strand:- start:29926 stop:30741 length:816 start_codon:yes stop_codon:yes gene_type:complete
MLKIYYLSSEIKPFSEAGQLGSFSKEFSSILKENKDVDIRLIQPKYGFISDRRYILREVIRLKNLSIEFMGKENIVNLKSGFIPGTRVQVYFMEHEKYFHDTSELLYKSRNGRFYSNNSERFTFFIKAAIETLKKLYWTPDYIICSDWQMSMAAIIAKELYKDELKDTKMIHMIHDLSDFYNFDSQIYKDLGVDSGIKGKIQNNLINSISLSDYVYIFNDDDKACEKYINKNKKIKESFKKVKHEFIDYSDSLDVSERIEVYNHILKKLSK